MTPVTVEDLQAATAGLVSFTAELDAPRFARGLGDDGLLAGLRTMGEARKALDVLSAALSSEVDRRSTRDRGYDGLAQATRFRSATSLIQTSRGSRPPTCGGPPRRGTISLPLPLPLPLPPAAAMTPRSRQRLRGSAR